MGAAEDRKEAEKYADDDVLAVLYRQHADITDALEKVSNSQGQERQDSFAAATALMKKHETAEQTIVRPVVEEAQEAQEAEQRTAEERDADQIIASMSSLDVDSAEFDSQLSRLKNAVTAHAESEETDEFPIVEKSRTEDQRIELGRAFRAAVAG